jgi:isopentenyl phosphate kinase
LRTVANPQPSIPGLQFLKLGGSLITDKQQPGKARFEVISRLAEEIAQARRADPELKLILGHGSGSFGHVPAEKYSTRHGAHTPEEWEGFTEVWLQAATLNHLVMAALHAAGLPAMAFPVSAAATAEDGEIIAWDIAPLVAALEVGLLPVVYGDVAFDWGRGGTILSTEDIFEHLARKLSPESILLAGLEAGVWADYPQRSQLLSELTPGTLEQRSPSLGEAAGSDVTGGMVSKTRQMLDLVGELPGLEVLIFSGEPAGAVREALGGKMQGTRLHAD